MSAQNNFKGKYQEGTFANGQGPVNGLHVSREEEAKGQLNSATSGRKLSAQGGQASDALSGMPQERNFDLYSQSYMGPTYGSLRPRNLGDVSNFKVNEK